MSKDKVHFKQAYKLAVKTLRSNYTDLGIQAGQSHFSDIWTRDCVYASWGSLHLKDNNVVLKSLKTCIEFQLNNGQIPLRVGQKYFLKRYFNLFKKSKVVPEGVYIEDKYISVPVDCNPLFLIMLGDYSVLNPTDDFLSNAYESGVKALNWCFETSLKPLLMEEGSYAGWADSLKKKGHVFYSHVLLYQAIKRFSKLAHILDKKEDCLRYDSLLVQVKKRIKSLFWTGDYYADWVYKGAKSSYFSTEANLMAIIFGLSNIEESRAALLFIKHREIDNGFCIDTRYPRYSWRHIYPLFFGFGMQDYHNGMKWLWVACLHAVALFRAGEKEGSNIVMQKLAEKINEYKGIFEVYEPCGKPVKRLFYKSEKSFAWSSGLFVWACHECGHL